MPIDPNDGGVFSRKLWLTVGTMLLMVVCWFMTGRLTFLATTFDALVGGLLGALAMFIVGNVSNKYVVAKQAAGAAQNKEGA